MKLEGIPPNKQLVEVNYIYIPRKPEEKEMSTKKPKLPKAKDLKTRKSIS